MKRRDFLKLSGVVATQTFFASAALNSLWIPSAHGDQVSLQGLRNALNPRDGRILVPQDPDFKTYQVAFNKRTLKVPLVRVLCSTPEGVAAAINWAVSNKVPLAMRSGGHSFEGFSQSTGLVIDTRPMDKIILSQDANSFYAGAGVQLGNVYSSIAARGRAVPAGTCPSVGLTGHTLGGGFGLLSRPLGLACDSLLSVQMVNAEGKLITCNESENSDLFWALRGGGAGSFGIVTQLTMKAHRVQNVLTYRLVWKVQAETAARLMKAWQQMSPSWPKEIATLMKVSNAGNGLYNVRCIGQSVGSQDQLTHELSRLTAIENTEITIKARDFMESVRHFGGAPGLVPVTMKGKSDYLKKVMSDEGLSQFLSKIPSGIDVIFDAYGGAISNLKDDATAFAHRENVVCSLQYYTQWETPAQGEIKLARLRSFHQAMRPYMSGSAYFNYCDLDLTNWGEAYWGKNFARLIQIKAKHDPKNIFKHGQSIPVKG